MFEESDLLTVTTDIVSAYVAANNVRPAELPVIIAGCTRHWPEWPCRSRTRSRRSS